MGTCGVVAAGLRRKMGAWSPWRRRFFAAGSGILAAGALPPLHFVFLLPPAFTGFVWLIDTGARKRSVFAEGWWFGFGFFTAGLFWISFALLTKPDQFAWLVPFAIFGLPAALAFFTAFGALAARAFWRPGMGRILVFSAFWVAFEWLRGWIFTGFPWNLMGTVWTFSDSMIQGAAVVGVFGLSLLTVIVAAMPALLADGGKGGRVLAAFAVLGLVWAGGAVRLQGAGNETVPGVRLRLVQPNIPQRLKWIPELRKRHLLKQLRMSTRPADKPPTLVIWAESAATFLLTKDKVARSLVGAAAPPGGLVLTGAPREDPEGKIWNSLHVLDSSGRIRATYDKAHLVPFGEYMPFRGLLNIDKITGGGRDFSAGPGRVTLRLPGLPAVSPLICYEVIFSGQVVDGADRPSWILNITNDAWYGKSPGPYQHFAAARLRAVEEGLPLVRVANTGISAIVDPYGRVNAILGLGEEGILDGNLPLPLKRIPFYARFNAWITLALILSVMGAGLWRRRRLREE